MFPIGIGGRKLFVYRVSLLSSWFFAVCDHHQGSHSTGKTEKIVKSNSRQGKHMELKNLKRESQNQETNCRIANLLLDIDEFTFEV